MKNYLKTVSCLSGLLLVAGISTVSRAQSCCGGSGAPMMIESYAVPAESIEVDPLADPVDPTRTVYLTVIVPEKAKVIVNGEPTYTKGSVRQYIVRDLQPGKKYQFQVVGHYVNEFEAEYKDTENVTIEAGKSEQVVLHLRRVPRAPKPPAPPVVPPVPPAPPAA